MVNGLLLNKIKKIKKKSNFFQKGIDKADIVCYNNEATEGSPQAGECAGVAELADARDLKSRDT